VWYIQRLSDSPSRVSAVRGLVRDYMFLPDAWQLQGGPPTQLPLILEREISELPSPAEPPRGDIAMAIQDDQVFAVALLVPFDEETCELKRLYVSQGMRRNGVGRGIVQNLIALAKELDYCSVVLDVMRERSGAVELYQSLGFAPVTPFRHYDSHTMLFFEYSL